MANTNITPPRVPLIDERTGEISRPWYLFLLSLFDVTGGGGSTLTLTDLQVEPVPQPVQLENIKELVREFETQPTNSFVADELVKALQQLEVLPRPAENLPPDVFYSPLPDIASLTEKVDSLTLAPVAQPTVAPMTGRAVLVGGTVVVSNPNVTDASNIFLTSQVSGGTSGALRISARTAGTSFTITSTSVLDTSTVAYLIT